MQQEDLMPMRHSLAHIMAAAVQQIWPDAQFGVGPTTDDGFYYDVFIPSHTISEEDFPKIEKAMRKLIAKDFPFDKSEKQIDEALQWASSNDQPLKVELLNDLKRSGTTLASDLNEQEMGTIAEGKSKVEAVSFYTCGPFTDLCRGPHVSSTGSVGAFKLSRVGGVYWRGDESRQQLQRIYGYGFKDQKDLDDHIEMLKQAKLRDHRKLGQELDLFVISDLVGPGLPLFTPRGTVLRLELIRFSEELQRRGGYQAVWAPHMTRIELYKRSGHYDKYPERFEVSSSESEDSFMLKPMNCPHVAQIYALRPRSYRDLPLRYMETTTMYRDEKSGELHGLSRVRSLTQDDSHAFVRPNQVENEFRQIIGMVKEMYRVLDMPLSVDLSFRDDSDNYFGTRELWAEAETTIEKIAQEEALDYKIVRGEAAFYGPKIDIHVRDALGRKWQCATIQLDYVMPERFGLTFVDADGQEKRPAMIHKAILGSIERFLSVYIEHTAGRFPVWVAPEQLRFITLNQSEEVVEFATKAYEQALALGLRCALDNDSESVGKKIRKAEMMKVPYSIVIGNKEVETEHVTPRIRSDLTSDNNEAINLPLNECLASIAQEASQRLTKTTLVNS